MAPGTLRGWDWIHKWTSLVCTLFMLLLCLTGLPLIFYEEIIHATGGEISAPPLPAGSPPAPRASLDAVVAAAVAQHPGKQPLYVFAEPHEPDLWLVKLDTRVDSDESAAVFAAVDARTAQVLGAPVFNQGVMHVIYRLHVDLFGGLVGRLFLGAMGLLLVIAIVSGVVLYAPFMRRQGFASLRRGRSGRLVWLDLHNLLGIVTVVWALAVGATGVINTWADLILKAWQAEQMTALKLQRAAGAGAASLSSPATARPGAAQRAIERAQAERPGMQLATLAYPGTLLATPGHFAVLMTGDSALTSRLQEPVLVDPDSGRVVLAGPRPWYVSALQLSQPLHFGDYGGLPLKLLWALLDLITLLVLWSGQVLWWRKRAGARRATADADACGAGPGG